MDLGFLKIGVSSTGWSKEGESNREGEEEEEEATSRFRTFFDLNFLNEILGSSMESFLGYY